MAEASAIVLGGFRLRLDAKIVCWPDRYMDGRGREFWGRVMALLKAGPISQPSWNRSRRSRGAAKSVPIGPSDHSRGGLNRSG
jgi:hypothetical protein